MPLGCGRRAEPHEDVVGRLLGTVGDVGHVAQVDRAARLDVHHDTAHVARIPEELPRLHHGLPVACRVVPGRDDDVGLLQGAHDLEGRHVVRPEPLRVQHDADLAPLASYHGALGYVLALLDLAGKLLGDAPELIAGVAWVPAPERERQDGHVVDGLGLDQGLGHPGRDDVVVGHELGVELDQARFHVLAHIEADDGQVGTRPHGRVDVLHPRYLPEELLHGRGDPSLHLGRRGAGVAHHYVDHGDHDLGLLLPGRHQHGKEPQEQ